MLKNLRVSRPLTFIDLETTGVEPRRDRIVEIALVQIAPGMSGRTLELRFNPEQPIPAGASAIHGIRDEHVAGCPRFTERAKKIASHLNDSDLAGFGIAHFALPFLVAEFERAGWSFSLRGRKVVDAQSLFHRLEPRDLSAAVRHYCGHEHDHEHRAVGDVLASIAVLDAMLGKHRDVPRKVNELHDLLVSVDVEGWFRRDGATVYFTRGKHRDVSLQEVACRDSMYLSWLADRVLPDARRLIDKALGNDVG